MAFGGYNGDRSGFETLSRRIILSKVCSMDGFISASAVVEHLIELEN
jgi:hypothetical protein